MVLQYVPWVVSICTGSTEYTLTTTLCPLGGLPIEVPLYINYYIVSLGWSYIQAHSTHYKASKIWQTSLIWYVTLLNYQVTTVEVPLVLYFCNFKTQLSYIQRTPFAYRIKRARAHHLAFEYWTPLSPRTQFFVSTCSLQRFVVWSATARSVSAGERFHNFQNCWKHLDTEAFLRLVHLGLLCLWERFYNLQEHSIHLDNIASFWI